MKLEDDLVFTQLQELREACWPVIRECGELQRGHTLSSRQNQRIIETERELEQLYDSIFYTRDMLLDLAENSEEVTNPRSAGSPESILQEARESLDRYQKQHVYLSSRVTQIEDYQDEE